MPKSVLTSKNESIHQKAMRIMHLFTYFHSEGRFKKFRIRMPESGIRMWTEAVSGNLEKLRIQKYPGACGRSLKVLLSSFQLHGHSHCVLKYIPSMDSKV